MITIISLLALRKKMPMKEKLSNENLLSDSARNTIEKQDGFATLTWWPLPELNELDGISNPALPCSTQHKMSWKPHYWFMSWTYTPTLEPNFSPCAKSGAKPLRTLHAFMEWLFSKHIFASTAYGTAEIEKWVLDPLSWVAQKIEGRQTPQEKWKETI